MKRKTSDITSASGLKNGPPVLSGSHRRNPHQEKESASPVSSQEAEGDLPHTQRTEAETEEMWPQVKKFQHLQKPEEARNSVVRHTLRFRISILTSDIQPSYL